MASDFNTTMDKFPTPKIPKPEYYTCGMCQGRFEKASSDDDAKAEMHDNFGPDITTIECVLVCDPCYETVMPKIKVGGL